MSLRHHGYTLIELVAALVIGLVLLGIATATVGNGLEAARAADARTRLVASLALAGTRAGLTGHHVVACPSADGATCTGSIDWSAGWIVFVDPDEDGVRGATERLLYVAPALAGRVRLHSTSGRTRIVYQGNGGNAGSNATFTLCDGRGPAQARSLVISNAGNVREVPAEAEAAASTCAA